MTRRRALRIGVFAVAVALVYVLSPLTVWFAAAMTTVLFLSVRGMDGDERRRILWVVGVAVALRVVAIGVLFLSTDHAQVPFGRWFGDEEYFINRSLWLRNLALGQPLHRFDLEYAFEPYVSSRYIYVLALIQILVGPAPYGVHLLGVLFHVSGVLLLYRVVRGTLGRMPALFGLVMLLFMPSLFAWSISVLKEPLFVLLGAAAVTFAVAAVRSTSPAMRAAAVGGIAALALAFEAVRRDGALFGVAGVVLGLVIAFFVMRPRLFVTAMVAAPIVLGIVLSRPEAQLKAFSALQSAARQHWGMVVVSRGYPYTLLDERFYADIDSTSSMRLGEAARFVARGAASYVAEPLPWQIQSRAALVHVPEQVVWYLLVMLAVAGAILALRRDPLVASLLIGHAVVAAAAVAFTGGNVGTLVRHRGVALPYLVWLSGVAVCELIAMRQRRTAPSLPFAAPVTGMGSP